MNKHVCNLSDPWPVGHPLPPVDEHRLVGPEPGTEVLYTRVRRWGQGYPVVWHEETEVLPATVIERSYVWSPGECRHRGGYRRYDWSVIDVREPNRTYRVVVDDKDLDEVNA